MVRPKFTSHSSHLNSITLGQPKPQDDVSLTLPCGYSHLWLEMRVGGLSVITFQVDAFSMREWARVRRAHSFKLPQTGRVLH